MDQSLAIMLRQNQFYSIAPWPEANPVFGIRKTAETGPDLQQRQQKLFEFETS